MFPKSVSGTSGGFMNEKKWHESIKDGAFLIGTNTGLSECDTDNLRMKYPKRLK